MLSSQRQLGHQNTLWTRQGYNTTRSSRRPLTCGAAANSDNGAAGPAPLRLGSSVWLLQQSIVMASASAILGPLCDGCHSSHDVLHYDTSAQPVHLALGGLLQLETCWWVPLMFGLAGVILGVSHPLLDAWLPESRPRCSSSPTWAATLLCIAVFVLQYGTSGMLEQPLLGQVIGPLPALDVLLAAVAVAAWAAFDGTRQGLLMACLTGVAGPALEVLLINGPHLYHYLHPRFFGIPSWICWVYFCGGPAVGNLGRKVSSVILTKAAAASE